MSLKKAINHFSMINVIDKIKNKLTDNIYIKISNLLKDDFNHSNDFLKCEITYISLKVKKNPLEEEILSLNDFQNVNLYSIDINNSSNQIVFISKDDYLSKIWLTSRIFMLNKINNNDLYNTILFKDSYDDYYDSEENISIIHILKQKKMFTKSSINILTSKLTIFYPENILIDIKLI
jgi:hypothetical protein